MTSRLAPLLLTACLSIPTAPASAQREVEPAARRLGLTLQRRAAPADTVPPAPAAAPTGLLWEKLVLRHLDASRFALQIGGSSMNGAAVRGAPHSPSAAPPSPPPAPGPEPADRPPKGRVKPAPAAPTRRDVPPPHRGQGGSLRLEPQRPGAERAPGADGDATVGLAHPGTRAGTNPGDVGSNLTGIIPPGIERVVGVPADNSLLIQGTAEAIAEFRQIVRLLDVPQRQLRIRVSSGKLAADGQVLSGSALQLSDNGGNEVLNVTLVPHLTGDGSIAVSVDGVVISAGTVRSLASRVRVLPGRAVSVVALGAGSRQVRVWLRASVVPEDAGGGTATPH